MLLLVIEQEVAILFLIYDSRWDKTVRDLRVVEEGEEVVILLERIQEAARANNAARFLIE